MEEQQPQIEKGKRLTRKQAIILLVVAIFVTLLGRFLKISFVTAIGELTAIFCLISACTKKGLRWK